MKPLIKIGLYMIEEYQISIEKRGIFRLWKRPEIIQESYSQLSLEMSLLDARLPFKGWMIGKYKIFREYPFWVALNKGIPEFISLNSPDVYIYIMQRLNEV